MIGVEVLTNLFAALLEFSWHNAVMLALAGLLLYLAVAKEVEPLLLVPIAFGALLVNLPLTGLMEEHGLLRYFYQAGVLTDIFPCLIFIGIGAMIDFSPLLQNPRVLFFGGAAQFGVFLTLLIALALGFDKLEAVAVGMIGTCDGPVAFFVASRYAPEILGPVGVACYSYMALVPIIQPPLARLLTTREERGRVMSAAIYSRPVSKTVRVLFPLVVSVVTLLIVPMGAPLMGMLMLGNFLRECGVVERLSRAAQNELVNVTTLLLGLAVGATMEGRTFLRLETLAIFGLGLVALVGDTVAGILVAKLVNLFSREKINPLIGAAGISAFPMSARVAHRLAAAENPQSYLLMHAIGANTSGQIGSVVVASVVLAILRALGLI
ncbi:MAG: sodium ion-translocating decarboxylase subunit beta [Clostridia bacterium]|jgi:oxaloacetate decarboxylase beta subunit|nr:sodium ion-translocating decarboxylase subunit beta [Clostridia bacterium]MDH7573985.1 sodium ion-translocating decarboxylase subunit beta [Clostridia bacterium]